LTMMLRVVNHLFVLHYFDVSGVLEVVRAI